MVSGASRGEVPPAGRTGDILRGTVPTETNPEQRPARRRAQPRGRAPRRPTTSSRSSRASDDELAPVLELAREHRDAYLERAGIPGAVTYSRKVFIPLTYLCRYRCSYCTFVKTREHAGAEFRSLDEVLAIATEGRE